MPALVLGLVALLSAPAAAAQGMKGDYHEDARFGFKIRPPKEWRGIPVPSGQFWVIGKYLSEKKYFYTEKGSYTYEFQPEMTIVAFVSEELKKATRRTALEKAVSEEAKQELEAEFERAREADFRDYKDYLTKTYSEGGFYFSKEEAGDHGGLRTTIYEAKVEKSAQGGPKRIVAWVYSLPDVDIAVGIEVLDQDYAKLQSMIDSTFKSLKAIPRSGELPVLQGQAGSVVVIEDLGEMTPEERKTKRLESQADAQAKAIAGLAEGWHHSKIDGFLVVSRADKDFDKEVAEQARAVFDWLEKTFPYVGPGEYVRQPVIRVCKDFEEERSFRGEAGAMDMMGLGLEVTTNQEYAGTRSFEAGFLNRAMTQLWFNDRDRELWWRMPAWLQAGIVNTVADSTPKNGKLDFYRSDWTAETLRALVREGRALEPRDLIYLTRKDFSGGDGKTEFERGTQAQALVDYLLLGPGSKSSKTKNVIESYITSLKAVIAEIKQTDKELGQDEEAGEPKTEAEEEEARKADRERWEARERQLLEQAGRRTFSGWTERDWEDLAKGYFKGI
jgi:hypothetical protein